MRFSNRYHLIVQETFLLLDEVEEVCKVIYAPIYIPCFDGSQCQWCVVAVYSTQILGMYVLYCYAYSSSVSTSTSSTATHQGYVRYRHFFIVLAYVYCVCMYKIVCVYVYKPLSCSSLMICCILLQRWNDTEEGKRQLGRAHYFLRLLLF